MTDKKQMMIGMQDSGKTTLLAALFHVVESSQVENSLQLVDLEESREYLVTIRNKWLGCVNLGRTVTGKEEIVRFKLSNPETNEVVELVLPDLSGESFRDQWETRKSTKIFDELAQQTEGILFFIHPNTVKEPVRINKNKLVSRIIEEEEPEEQKEGKEEKTFYLENSIQNSWQITFAPTQVKLIEILQFLLREPDIYPLSHIAVIISAWDLLKKDYKSPSDWLTKRVPMFHQFLLANSDTIGFKAFGISAQGGELGEYPKDTPELLRKQSDRIEVITDIKNEYDVNDITAPIKWLMQNCN